jgi:hypothetical protein
MFSLQQNWRTREQNRFCLERGVGGVQIMYTHVSICKNDKIKLKKKTEAFKSKKYFQSNNRKATNFSREKVRKPAEQKRMNNIVKVLKKKKCNF